MVLSLNQFCFRLTIKHLAEILLFDTEQLFFSMKVFYSCKNDLVFLISMNQLAIICGWMDVIVAQQFNGSLKSDVC